MRLAAFVLLLLVFARAVLAVNATLALPEAPRANQWQTIAITGIPASGGVVTVKDLRGGLAISRPIPPTPPQTLLVPLPLIAPAELPPNTWPINITIHTKDGVTVSDEKVTILFASPSASAGFRVIIPENATETIVWTELSDAPISLLRVTPDDLLHAPPLTFASYDALIIPAALANKISEERALELMNAGLQLIALTTEPPAGGLSRFLWQHRPGFIWVCPVQPLMHPQLLESGLARLPSLIPVADPGSTSRVIILLMGPMTLAVVLLARFLFTRRFAVFITLLTAIPAASLIAAAIMRSSAPDTVRSVAWQTRFAAASSVESRGGPELLETLTTLTPFYRKDFHRSSPFLMPIAATPSQYFAMRNATLVLNTDSLSHHMTSLDLDVPAGTTAAWLERRARPAPIRPALPHPELRSSYLRDLAIDPAHAWWIDAGHIDSRSIEQFAADHPDMAPALLAWYELRFNAHDIYLLLPPDSSNPELRLTNFVNLTPVDLPPTSIMSQPPSAGPAER